MEYEPPTTVDGMREVEEDAFFRKMNPLDVHPWPVSPHYSAWKLRDGPVVGRSYPGWKYPNNPSRFFVADGRRS